MNISLFCFTWQDKNNVVEYNLNGSSEVAASASQSHQVTQMPLHFQKPTDLSPVPPEKCEDQQTTMHTQGPVLQTPSTNQVFENFHAPTNTAMLDNARWVSKMQIPTNPRIASSLAFGMPKADKESSTANAAVKPAYVSVQVPKPNNKLPSQDDADAIMKVIIFVFYCFSIFYTGQRVSLHMFLIYISTCCKKTFGKKSTLCAFMFCCWSQSLLVAETRI